MCTYYVHACYMHIYVIGVRVCPLCVCLHMLHMWCNACVRVICVYVCGMCMFVHVHSPMQAHVWKPKLTSKCLPQ